MRCVLVMLYRLQIPPRAQFDSFRPGGFIGDSRRRYYLRSRAGVIVDLLEVKLLKMAFNL